uniref:Uncharacterized protein n=1 Tax=Oryza sativa subsp. indica TaxID=39946 RepID=C5NNW5_ORYSI|nr:hypothetical protein [Oryza sativa Indica Group]
MRGVVRRVGQWGEESYAVRSNG